MLVTMPPAHQLLWPDRGVPLPPHTPETFVAYRMTRRQRQQLGLKSSNFLACWGLSRRDCKSTQVQPIAIECKHHVPPGTHKLSQQPLSLQGLYHGLQG